MKFAKEQLIPLILTFTTFIILSILLFILIGFLNIFTTHDIVLKLNLSDVLVGLTIYLKTSFDFAIFISSVMASNAGWKKRIAIEIGTACGNALGTFLILAIWVFFKEVPLLLALMIFLASMVLFQMAQEGFDEFLEDHENSYLEKLNFVLTKINSISSPVLSKVIPHAKIKNSKPLAFMALLIFSLSVPFILGLDDFAGYIPVFTLVNVFGFCVGVFLGHMILNALLFISPDKTVRVSKNPLVLLIGSGAFILIAAYGLFEVIRLFI